MLDVIKKMPGCSVNDAVKHLRLFEKARLVVSQMKGWVRALFFNAAPIQFYDRWTTECTSFWGSKAMDLKFQVEGVKP
jgi:hypothetical protein